MWRFHYIKFVMVFNNSLLITVFWFIIIKSMLNEVLGIVWCYQKLCRQDRHQWNWTHPVVIVPKSKVMMNAGLNWDWVELLIFCFYDVGGWILKLNYAMKGFSIDMWKPWRIQTSLFRFSFICSRVSFVLKYFLACNKHVSSGAQWRGFSKSIVLHSNVDFS